MGNPGIANLCQDARGGEFGQANLAIPELESTFFIAIAILWGVWMKSISILTNKLNKIICVIKSLFETFSIQ